MEANLCATEQDPVSKTNKYVWVWWHILGRKRQADFCEFEVSLVYLMCSRLARDR